MNVIGTVSLLIGNVVAVKADGTERLLSLGEEVYADEMIRVAPDASIEIAMDAGEPVRLDGGQNWLANAETYTESNNFDLSEATADVESIQAAILAGADPTAVSEATAAGGDTQAGGEGNEGSTTVNIERTAEEVDPNAGYETIGINDPVIQFEEELVATTENEPSESTDAVLVTVLLNDVTSSEDGLITYTASVDKAPQGDFIVTLDNGVEIYFASGSLIGSSEPQPAQGEDAYIDGESFDVAISSVSGGGYENLDLSDTSLITINDTIDETSVSLTAGPDFNEDGTTLTYTVELGAAVRVGDEAVTVNFTDLLGNAQSIVISSGTTGTVDVVIPESAFEDVYAEDAADLTVATEVSVSGGSDFEALGTPSVGTVNLIDTEDATSVSLTAGPDFNEDGTTLTYTVELGAAVRVGDEAVTVNFTDLLGNAQSIVISSGTTGTVDVVIPESAFEDVYAEDAADLTVATEVSVSGGSDFEALGTPSVGTVNLIDTEDATSVSLTAGPDFNEDGTTLTYTVELGAAVRVGDEAVTVNFTDLLGNAQSIVISSGTTGTVDVVIPESAFEDVYAEDAADLTVATEVSVSGGSDFEALGTPSVGTVNLIDTEDATSVSLTAGPDFNEDGTTLTYTVELGAAVRVGDEAVTVNFTDLLGNAQSIVISSGTTGTVDVVIPESAFEDVYAEDAADLTVATEVSVSGGSDFEALGTPSVGTVNLIDTEDATSVSLTAGPDFNEDGTTLTYTVELGAAVRVGDEAVTVNFTDLLGNAQSIVISSGTTGTVDVVIPESAFEDVYAEDAADLTVATEVSVSGGSDFEALGTPSVGTVNLIDTEDATSVSLTAGPDFNEDGTTLTYTVELGAAVRVGDEAVTVNFTDLLGNAQSIVISSGTTGTVDVVIPESAFEDVYAEDAADLTVATEVSVSGGSDFEALGTPSVGTVNLIDTEDATSVSLTAGPDFNEDGTTLTYTVELGAAVRVGDEAVTVNFTDLLGNAQSIVISSGTTGTVDVVIPESAFEDVYAEDAADLTVATEVSVSGGSDFEALGTPSVGTVNLIDTEDATSVSLTAGPDFNEDGTTLTYTVELGAAVRVGDEAVTVNFTDLLGNAQSIVISSGTTGTVDVVIPESAFEDVYAEDAADLTVATEVSVSGGSDFEALGTPSVGTVNLIDTEDATSVSLTAGPDFNEDGTTLTYTVELGAAVRVGDEAVTVNFTDLLGNAQSIVISSGTTGTVDVVIPESAFEDVYAEDAADLTVATEVSVSGGSDFEALGTPSVGTVNLIDTEDATSVSLTAGPDFNEDGTTLTYTVELGAAVRVGDEAVTVNFTDLLGNAQSIVISSGTTGTVDVVIPESAFEDVYAEDAADLTVATEVSVSGGSDFEALGTPSVGTVNLIDTEDATSVSLTAGPDFNEDGTTLTYTVELGAAVRVGDEAVTVNFTDLLGNAQSIVISSGTTGTVDVVIPESAFEDVYAEDAADLTVATEVSVSGGSDFEALGTPSVGTVNLIDTEDATSVSLTAGPDFNEDGTTLTYTVELGAAVRVGDEAVTVNFTDLLGNAQSIVISSGTTGTVDVVIPESAFEDVYAEDAADLTVATEVSVSGGSDFEALGTPSVGTVNLIDTEDATSVSLTAGPDFNEDGTTLTYTVELGAAVRVGDEAVTVNFTDLLGNAQSIVISSGTTGTVDVVIPESAFEDVYAEDAADLTVATEVSVSGGSDFEALGTPSVGTVNLIDTEDATSVSLTAGPDFNEDGTTLTYTVELGAAVRVGDEAVTVNFTDLLGNAQSIVISSGTTGTVDVVIPESAFEDVYAEDAADLTVATEVSVSGGSDFEALGTPSVGTVNLIDTEDATSVSLTAGPDFNEDGTTLTYTVELGAAVRVGDEAVTVNFTDLLGNAQSIVISSGTTGTVDVVIPESAFEDVYAEDAADLTVATEVSVSGGSDFEALGTPSVGTVNLIDTEDATSVSLTAGPDFNEDGTTLTYTVELGAAVRVGDEAVTVNFTDLLGNAQSIVISSGTTGTVDVVIPESAFEDVYAEDAADLTVATEVSVSGGSDFEALGTPSVGTVNLIDTEDATSVSLTAGPDFNEDGTTLTYTVELGAAVRVGDEAVTVNFTDLLGNAQSIVISSGTTGTVDVVIPESAFEDVYAEDAADLTVATEVSVSGGSDFEALGTPSVGTVNLIDTEDATSVSLTAGPDFNEDGTTLTYTVELGAAVRVGDEAVTVNFTDLLGNAQSIVISSGTTGTVDVVIPESAFEDVYAEDAADLTVATEVSVSGGSDFEALGTPSVGTVNLIDTEDATSVSLTAGPDFNEDGTTLTYTVELGAAVRVGDEAVTVNFTDLLGNAQSIVISSGTTGTVDVVIPESAFEDVYAEDAADLTVATEVSVSGGSDFEALGTPSVGTVNLIDTEDATSVSLTAGPDFNEDGTTLTYTVELGAAVRVGDEAVTVNFTDLLGNAQSIVISSGTTGTVDVVIPESAFEDVYAEDAADLTVATEVSVSGGSDFEALGTPSVGTVNLIDTEDATSVSLTAGPDFNEDGTTLTYTVELGAAVRVGDEAVTVNFTDLLGNAQSIVISSGTTGTVDVVIPESAFEDVYAEDAADLTVATEVSVSGGSDFEALGTPSVGTVNLIDTEDATSVSLTAGPDFNEDGTTLTYTVELGAAVRVGDEAVTVNFTDLLGNAQSIVISSGTTGTVDVVIPESAFEDVYAEDAADLTVATEVSVSGGSDFEALGTPSVGTVNLTDTVDETSVGISASADFNDESVTFTYTVELGEVVRVGDEAVTVNFTDLLGNAQSIVISSGATGALVVTAAVAAFEDVYAGSDSELVVATEVSVSGGGFELLGTPSVGTINTPPSADDVSTQSNLSTDSLDANFPIGNYAFIKKIDIGGGLDGDLSVAENDDAVGGDPADLGGSDLETAEDSLIFSLDSLPDYGDIYLLQDGSYIKLDASEIQSDQFSTSDTLYWVAEHDQVLESTGSTISFDFTQGFDAVAASSAGLDVIAYGLDGTQSSVTQINNDGLGVDSGSDDRINQIEYADGNTETLLFDFDQPVTNATIGVTHLINSESGGEIGVVHAYLDGALVGTWTFTASSTAVADFSPSNGNVDTTSIGNNNGTGSASFTLSDIAFDQLRFVGTEYQNENSPSDSSDYYVASLAYDLVDDVSFTYSVEDEKGLTSSSATVAINVNSDTPVPTDLSSTVKPSVFEDVKEVEESLLASSSPVIVSGNLLANDNLLGIDSELTHIDGIRVDPTGITVITTDIGELTVYTDDFNGRLAGDYDYELTSTTDEGVNDIDQFAYTVTNVNGAEASTNLTIRVIDDLPVAVNDSDAVIDTSVVVEGNVLSNDYLSVDVDNKVTSVNGNPVSPSGDTVIQGAYGALTIDANGEYSYEYNATSETIRVKVNDTQGAVISAYSDTESSFAFDLYNADGSLNLNPTIQSDVSVSTHGSASANKQGYGVSDNNGAATLDNGEYLVYELSKAVSGSFTFVIGQYNANQTDPADIQWQAFAADGSLLTTGDLSNGSVPPNSNGTYTGNAEGISGEVKYLVFTITDPSGQGITLTEISYDYYPTGIDSFEYEIEDADGDTSSATLNITSDEYLVGDSSNNDLAAGDGDDILIGQAGNDILTGGEGEDLFVWSKSDLGVDNLPAADQIVDFNTSENDVIDLSDVLSDGSHVISAVENADGNLQLQITDASSSNVVQTIDLNNVAADADVAAQLQQLLDNNNIDDGIN
ncbi:retention module-containing protein [Neptuniibacter sp. QD48_55]|uniref:retention module-containing protein n=1 Tax=Neptuniibacter sp. QD48_55 TaxID=3398212 RepID=UPI0039F56543